MMNEEYRTELEKQFKENSQNFPQKQSNKELTEQEQEENEDELLRLMHDRFILGEDTEYINYDEIDKNGGLDDFKQQDQDDEDRYFDNDEGY
ncbi:hypothetical protein IMG5_195540 [Ichthyophthirius multifiliis]|uniref:CCD97-like C-terminal domain-containing protein n=1 Tax=Ichthyophthirius multifiliis TaxID=5932 RepID=G0R4Y8_ICHMU|nr:hypothetical protein IMG5_195540 [Ichthyophthirius multifiliis]EGR27472.1 hypothetical protein IMG5_195540 [Ichthyophthirius multifiliis]|eukprot:XP_004024382.1 hypothetical protein IMG5_195540 [Ichthyophthirius multifiliis]